MPTNIAKWVLDLHRNWPPHQPFCVPIRSRDSFKCYEYKVFFMAWNVEN